MDKKIALQLYSVREELKNDYTGVIKKIADMAYALQSGQPHQANGDMAFHVLETIHAFQQSSESGRHMELKTSCEKTAPLPTGLAHGLLNS